MKVRVNDTDANGCGGFSSRQPRKPYSIVSVLLSPDTIAENQRIHYTSTNRCAASGVPKYDYLCRYHCSTFVHAQQSTKVKDSDEAQLQVAENGCCLRSTALNNISLTNPMRSPVKLCHCTFAIPELPLFTALSNKHNQFSSPMLHGNGFAYSLRLLKSLQYAWNTSHWAKKDASWELQRAALHCMPPSCAARHRAFWPL